MGLWMIGRCLLELPVDMRPAAREHEAIASTRTGLVWQRADQAPATWEAALAACESLVLAGASDWRLPTIKELLTIVDDTRTAPAIDTAAFTGATGARTWSATPVAPQVAAGGSCSYAHVIDFATGLRVYGNMGRGTLPSPDTARFRCVR